MKFKVGDRVTVKPYDEATYCGGISPMWWKAAQGVVFRIDEILERDEHDKGWATLTLVDNHDACDRLEDFVWPMASLMYTDDQHTIVIYNKGTTTTAVEKVNGKEVKRATAKLHPEDDYKWETGRNLALNRLLYGTDYHPSEVAITPEEPKYYNGKVVCLDIGLELFAKLYTVGKIYEFKDGIFLADNGKLFSENKKYHNFEEFKKDSRAKWLEIVE